MDDYEPWLTPCDPDFDPEKCESAYALWAVKEEGEPVKFLEASITDNLDYPSGYWFFWRTISFSEETGRLIEGEWGGAGDICRADYVADMVLPGGAVFARVQGELDDGIPFDWEVRRPLDDCAKTRAAEAIRAGILALPLSASASIEAIPSPYKIDVSIVHGGTLTHDMARNLLVSAEHYYRDSALCGLLDNWNGLAVAQRALLVQTAKSMREDSPDEAFASLSRAIALIRATDERADWPALDEYSFEEIRDETVAEWRAHIAEGVVEKPVTPTDLARSASAAAATSAVIAASANQTAPKL